eukprot:5239835-Lingulodinium_polyedra.AAC.1
MAPGRPGRGEPRRALRLPHQAPRAQADERGQHSADLRPPPQKLSEAALKRRLDAELKHALEKCNGTQHQVYVEIFAGAGHVAA